MSISGERPQEALQLITEEDVEHRSVHRLSSLVSWSQCLVVQESERLNTHVLCDIIKRRVKI